MAVSDPWPYQRATSLVDGRSATSQHVRVLHYKGGFRWSVADYEETVDSGWAKKWDEAMREAQAARRKYRERLNPVFRASEGSSTQRTAPSPRAIR